jgi:hypothetical protein
MGTCVKKIAPLRTHSLAVFLPVYLAQFFSPKFFKFGLFPVSAWGQSQPWQAFPLMMYAA